MASRAQLLGSAHTSSMLAAPLLASACSPPISPSGSVVISAVHAAIALAVKSLWKGSAGPLLEPTMVICWLHRLLRGRAKGGQGEAAAGGGGGGAGRPNRAAGAADRLIQGSRARSRGGPAQPGPRTDLATTTPEPAGRLARWLQRSPKAGGNAAAGCFPRADGIMAPPPMRCRRRAAAVGRPRRTQKACHSHPLCPLLLLWPAGFQGCLQNWQPRTAAGRMSS